MPEHAPFFVIGAGRSGTTLLRLILTGHSRLHIPAETWFLQPLVRSLPLTGPLTQAQCERTIGIMVQHERWPDMNLPAETLRREVALLDQPTLVDLIGIVYRHLRLASGKLRLGDKTPHYFSIVPELATLYPTATFVHLIRDGRDVAISWIDAGWQRYYEHGFEWPAAMACRGPQHTAYPDRILDVHYEDLVRQPEAVVRAICHFLGEAFEPRMLEWRDRTHMVAGRDRSLHGRLSEPLSEDAVAVWRLRLSAAECFAIEACLHRELIAAGYQLRFGARGWRPVFCVTGATLRFLSPLLRRAIPYLQRRGMLPRSVYL